ncbi:MAG: 50S ribosomal protein L6 [Planctomycetota bacterium]|nr:MAG: 50S ribosomal protein L6 [Planctomycetota bacterium]
MSRIGKKPVVIPEGVKVERQGRYIKISGPLGDLQVNCHPRIKVKIVPASAGMTPLRKQGADGKILVENGHPEIRQDRQLHGTMRSLIANAIVGVSKGFEKKMEIYGTGYSVNEQGGKLIFQIGFCHLVERVIPKGVKVTIEVGATRGNDVPAKFTLFGIDKCLLGQFAADIRKIKPPEPYKGKGIRYADEQVKRKAGKAFATGAA